MNSNPSFYPKHLAKQYVGLWSLDQARGHGGPLGQPVVVSPALGAPASNVSSNGQRSVTPVGGNQHLNQSTGGGGSTESSPSFSTIMDTSVSSRQNQEPSKKILQGLPDSFITAMRRLFDLLDIEQAGRVHIHDIAENWSPDAAAGSVLPPNIVPSLRKVMTPDGYLTFERFCAGLKISILRHSAQRHRQADNDSTNSSSNDIEDQTGSGEALVTSSSSSPLSRTNSLPNLYSCGSPSDNSDNSSNISSNHNANSPNHSIHYNTINDEINKLNANHAALNRMSSYGPPKPPRDPSRLTATNLQRISTTYNTGGAAANDDSLISSRSIAGSTSSLPAAMNNNNNNNTRSQHSQSSTMITSEEAPLFIWKPPPPPFISHSHFDVSKRGSNSKLGSENNSKNLVGDRTADVNVLVKAWEHERNLLEEGLILFHQTQQYYKEKLADVQSKLQRNIHTVLPFSNYELDQEQTNKEISKIRETNAKLKNLTNPSREPPPPLANSTLQQQELLRRIERLQEQNRMLTDEVGRQSNRVTALEQDKRSLIKQLFQSSSTNSISSSVSNASTLR